MIKLNRGAVLAPIGNVNKEGYKIIGMSKPVPVPVPLAICDMQVIA